MRTSDCILDGSLRQWYEEELEVSSQEGGGPLPRRPNTPGSQRGQVLDSDGWESAPVSTT